jgi:hypothetical protein
MSYEDEISGKELRWIENGSETWQIFLGSLHGRMAEKGCMRCITQPRPVPRLAGAAAVVRQRLEDVKEWDDWDERAYGIINAAMRDCPSAKLRLAQIVPDNIGCGRHAAAALATLAEKFDFVDLRTETNHRAAYEAAKLGRNQSCTDFVSELKNLRARLLQLNETAVDDRQSIIRLTDGLSGGKEIVIQALSQGITNASALNPAMTFDAACVLAIGFDNTPMGKDRLIGGGTVAVADSGPASGVVRCHNCKRLGHLARECTVPRKKFQRVALMAAAEAAVVAALGPRSTGRKTCSHCKKEGHEEPNCFIAHPEKMEQYQKDKAAKRQAYRAGLAITLHVQCSVITFCGDYATLVNHYIETGHYPIPHVFHTLERKSKYKLFFDLDMTNSYHQFPLAEKTRRLLSIQTPWGQYEPLFLPEGVPPASGILQKFVSEVFADFSDWLIGIFDNILVLAKMTTWKDMRGSRKCSKDVKSVELF